jgi:co-chaperonin GroES (HSP10)
MGKTLRPIGINVLVSKIQPETVTKSGIIIPELATREDHVYTVVAVGDGVRPDGSVYPMPVKAGDKVQLSPYLGTPLPSDANLKLVAAFDILAVIDED